MYMVRYLKSEMVEREDNSSVNLLKMCNTIRLSYFAMLCTMKKSQLWSFVRQ